MIGLLEHMRNMDGGDDLQRRVDRLQEDFDISPTKENRKKLILAIDRLIEYTDQMAEIYEVNCA